MNLKKYFTIKNEEKKYKINPLIIGMIIALWAVLIGMGILAAEKYIYMTMVKDDVISEVTSIVNLNKDIMYKKGEAKFVANFDIEKDTLPFKNFRSYSAAGGNCEGYNMYELLKFEGNLEKVLGENMKSNSETDLSRLELSDKDIDNIYNVSEGDIINYYLDYNILKDKPINYEKLVKKSYGYDKDESPKIESSYSDKEFDNEELKNVLEDIEYLHKNKNYTIYNAEPYNTYSPKDKKKGINYKYSVGDIDFIKNSIDDNKLIEIAMQNAISGHSLLAYGYEKIDENNYKVYVKDSNAPIIKKEVLTPEEVKANEDIKNNFYVLFTKDILKDRWSYLYQPSINGYELYGYYNSFIPDTSFSIYSTGL